MINIRSTLEAFLEASLTTSIVLPSRRFWDAEVEILKYPKLKPRQAGRKKIK